MEAMAARDVNVARHWIDGEWHASGTVVESRSPSTGDVLGQFADGGVEHAIPAIRAARFAFDRTSWSRDRESRARSLLELADRLEERRDALALMLAREEGKLLGEATWEVGASPGMLRHAAAMVLARSGGRACEVAPGVYFQTLTEPIGVAAIIAGLRRLQRAVSRCGCGETRLGAVHQRNERHHARLSVTTYLTHPDIPDTVRSWRENSALTETKTAHRTRSLKRSSTSRTLT